MLDNIIKKVDKINYSKLRGYQRSQYFQLKNRIECLLTLQFFLSLRQKIKKQVQENYFDKTEKEIVNSIVDYDIYGFVEFKNHTLYIENLQPLINDYVKKQIFEIEKHNLKLAL